MGTRSLLFFAVAGVAVAQISSPLSPPKPDYVAMTAKDRANWVLTNTLGPANLLAGAVTSALATRSNEPPEYGPHWAGYAKRNGLRISARATSSVMEAGLGSLWGEDPRYFRAPGQSLNSRLGNVLGMTLIAHNKDGNKMPAYARYIAIPGSNFLSNTWRPDSQRQMSDVVGRITISLISRVIGNAFAEFGPDLRKRFSKKKAAASLPAAPAGQ